MFRMKMGSVSRKQMNAVAILWMTSRHIKNWLHSSRVFAGCIAGNE